MTIFDAVFLKLEKAVLKNLETQHQFNLVTKERLDQLQAKAVEQQVTIDRLSVDVLNIEDNLGIE